MTLKSLMQQYVEYKNLHQLEGVIETRIPGVRFYHKTEDYARQPMLHDPGIIVMGQGKKSIYAYGDPIHYGRGDCVIMGVPMPLECEARTENGEPLLGISIDISIGMLQKLVSKCKSHQYQGVAANKLNTISIRCAAMAPRMVDACQRLMLALCNDMEAEVLGESLVEEVVFWALLSDGGSVLFELADQEGRYARIASVLERIHQNYAESLNVSELASDAHMSVSAFHTVFRNVTHESPIQYIKKVRLNKARELIRFEGKRVNDTAHLVGYSSTSQFSREFKRQFNESPKEAAMAVA